MALGGHCLTGPDLSSGRHVSVVVDEEASHEEPVLFRVPQRTVLVSFCHHLASIVIHFTFQSAPHKPLGHNEPNLAVMIHG